MVEQQGIVRNYHGIHMRPSSLIRKAVADYAGTVQLVGTDGKSANPRSVLSILSLSLVQGSTFTVRVEGPDEQQFCDKLVELMESTFDFDR